MLAFRKTKPKRDSAWLRAVVERYEPLLLRYAMRRTRDWELAQDVVQAAFLKLIEHTEIADADLPQWLYTVCLNQFLDGKRAEAVRAKHVTDVPQAGVLPSALARLVDQDDFDCLFKALASLTVLQKLVVELRFVDELSYREIARLIHKTESHVGVVLHESLKKLRIKHQEECGDFLENVPA